MKKILSLFICLLFGASVHSDTTWVYTGLVSGTWTLEGSPYLIQGLPIIDNGQTLTIEAGVTVEFQGSYSIYVQGQILVLGTEPAPILFTAADTIEGFNSIRFMDTDTVNDTSRFEYCIFRYGRVYDPFPDNCGGAIGARYFGKFIIDHCIFEHNSAVVENFGYPGGGAVALWGSSPVIKNSRFEDNISIFGGAISCYKGSDPSIKHNVFYENVATLGGAISCLDDSHPVIRYNLMHKNSSLNAGGGIFLFDTCSPVVMNNTIAQNDSENEDGGGGIDMVDGCCPEIRNNILWGNTADSGNFLNQVYVTDETCVPDFFYSDIEGGEGSVGGVGVMGEWYECIDDNPMFEDPDLGDYHLKEDLSPCIDAGDPEMFDPDSTRRDMGAFYCNYLAVGIPEFRVPGSGRSEATSRLSRDSGFRVEVFPNPAVDVVVVTVVSRQSLVVSQVILKIYDLFGREVCTLVDEAKSPGEYTVRMEVSNLPAGVYLVSVRAGGQMAVRKLVVR